MRIFILALLMAGGITSSSAQEHSAKLLYDTAADPSRDIPALVKQAAAQKKHVLIMAGGNWCSWCIRFNAFVHDNSELDSIIGADYLVYHLNYSKENRNKPTFAGLGYPQRFGFPVFLILANTGERIHTQNSAYLEEGKGYSKEKVKEFLLNWAPKAIDPKSYPD